MIKMTKIPVVMHKVEIDFGAGFDIDSQQGFELYDRLESFIENDLLGGQWWDGLGLELDSKTCVATLNENLDDEQLTRLDNFIKGLKK